MNYAAEQITVTFTDKVPCRDCGRYHDITVIIKDEKGNEIRMDEDTAMQVTMSILKELPNEIRKRELNKRLN